MSLLLPSRNGSKLALCILAVGCHCCQRDNTRRCYIAKVLGVRVYIGRSRKRWISTVRRPRAKLLRDVFVVSFCTVCELRRNHKPFVDGKWANGTEERAYHGRQGMKSCMGENEPTTFQFEAPARPDHPIIPLCEDVSFFMRFIRYLFTYI